MFHRVGADLYGHLHGIVITAHPQNLSFIDFAKCTMAESPEKAKWKIQQNKWEHLYRVSTGSSQNFKWTFILSRRAVPEKGYVLARYLLQFIEWSCLSCKAVVGVVVCHDGGGADLAQLVLWALQTPPHCMQVVLPAVPHWRQRQDGDGLVSLPSLRCFFFLIRSLTGPHTRM